METFKQLMAFPMFATVAWLIWVLGNQAGTSAMAECVFGLVFLSMGLWTLGRWGAPHRSPATRRMARAAGLVFAAIALYVALPLMPQELRASENHGFTAAAAEPVWERFNPARLNELRQAKQKVLIDFTAAWCLVCQVNHQRIFGNAVVQEKLREKKVVLLRADWTSRDPEITRILGSFGASGVPLVVLYGADDVPEQFPALIRRSDFLAALDRLARG